MDFSMNHCSDEHTHHWAQRLDLHTTILVIPAERIEPFIKRLFLKGPSEDYEFLCAFGDFITDTYGVSYDDVENLSSIEPSVSYAYPSMSFFDYQGMLEEFSSQINAQPYWQELYECLCPPDVDLMFFVTTILELTQATTIDFLPIVNSAFSKNRYIVSVKPHTGVPYVGGVHFLIQTAG